MCLVAKFCYVINSNDVIRLDGRLKLDAINEVCIKSLNYELQICELAIPERPHIYKSSYLILIRNYNMMVGIITTFSNKMLNFFFWNKNSIYYAYYQMGIIFFNYLLRVHIKHDKYVWNTFGSRHISTWVKKISIYDVYTHRCAWILVFVRGMYRTTILFSNQDMIYFVPNRFIALIIECIAYITFLNINALV